MGLTFQSRTYIASLEKTFPAGETFYFHPTFLYEMLWNVAGLLIMHIFSKKSGTKYPGQYFLFYVAWYGLGRFMIEGLRTDSLYIHGTTIRASQLLAALSFLSAVAILVYNHFRAKSAHGEDDEYEEDPTDDEIDEDAMDAESMQELVELDGASVDELDDEIENEK
jgi:phosphatidylglycerol:prolipoprotein diacylglycerol transferase